MWTFEQRTGRLLHDGAMVGRGYSGHDAGKLNPAMEKVKNIGPIPRGKWVIGPPFFHETKGPYVMRLLPCPGTLTFGRAGFLIHGDAIRAPGTASQGCIILPRDLRMKIGESHDADLEVVSGEVVNVA